MTTRLITQTDFPVTVAEAKLRLRIDDTGVPADDAAQDADIQMMITAATELAENKTRRSIATNTWQLKLDAFPAEIRLLYPPLVSVTSITYVDTAGVTQTLDASAYYVDSHSEPGWVVPATDTVWPDTMTTANAVTVNYTAGYGAANCPAAIKQFILMHVGHMFRNREAVTDKAMTVMPYGERMLDRFTLFEV